MQASHTTPGPVTDADVPAYLAALGIPGLADIHVHFLPERMLHKVWSYFDAAEQNYGYAWPIHYRYDTDTRLAIVRGLGMRAIPALTYPHKPGMAAWLNEWNREFAVAHADVVHCATLFAEPESAVYVPEALAAGARLFKVHVQVGGFAPDDPVLDAAWAALEKAGVPVVIHAGSRPLPGAHTGPDAIAAVLNRFPRLALVIAHMGMPEYEAFADLAERYGNVHLDTTMFATGFLDGPAVWPAGYLGRLGALRDRIVLGSDFPNIPYPYARQLSALADLELGDEWMRAVLWGNGARLLRPDPKAFLASVAISRFRFKGRVSFIVTILLIQMLPAEGLFIAQYKMMSGLGLLSNVLGLSILYVAAVVPFTIWMLRGFVAGIPVELEEAGMIDGLSRTQAFLRITFPLLAPGLVATGVFAFLQCWNEFTVALVIMENNRTLPLWLRGFVQQSATQAIDWGQVMAASTIVAIPVIVFFVIVQGRMTSGLVSGAVKG